MTGVFLIEINVQFPKHVTPVIFSFDNPYGSSDLLTEKHKTHLPFEYKVPC
jgi:hypothetical protein